MLTKQLHEAGMTVWPVILFFERALVQLLQAEGTDEVLRVELLAHRRDAAARNRLLAARTQRAPLGVVVGLTVGQALVVEELAARKWVVAILSIHEVLIEDHLIKTGIVYVFEVKQ